MFYDRSNVQQFRDLGPFSRCSRRELRQVEGLSTQVVVGPGHVLARQGSLCGEFAVIVSGTATVERNGEEVDELGRSDHFGELPLVSYVPNPTTITAVTEMQLEVMNQREFHTMYETMPCVRYYLDRQIDDRMFTWLTQPEPATVPDLSGALSGAYRVNTGEPTRSPVPIGYTFAQ